MNKKDPIAIVVLAAGLGKRMNSEAPKVMIEADGAPIIDYVLSASFDLKPERAIIVTGYKKEILEAHIKESFREQTSSGAISFAYQEKQLGTGDAVKTALPSLENFTGSVVIVCGDVPLIRSKTLEDLLAHHRNQSATVTLLSVVTAEPAQYGRIIRDDKSQVLSIKEFKDCNEHERGINEINSGIYVVDSSFLPGAIKRLKNENAQSEFYLTDIVSQASQEGQAISCLVHYNLSEVQGVNNRLDLAETTKILKERRIYRFIEAGVIFHDPYTVEIDSSVRIEPGAIIGGHVVIRGNSLIENGATIEGFSVLSDSTIKQGAVVHHFVHAHGAVIGSGSTVGPFARLREGTVLDGDNRIGNFVETKKAHLQKGAKASHLTYLGDCSVGERTNIGAGTITCNYDGVNKAKTSIGPDAFIGSNSVLIAPVTIGSGAFVGAGSTITKDVEADALAISRAEQKSIPQWAANRRKKKSSK